MARNTVIRYALVILLLLFVGNSYAGSPTRPYSYTTGTIVDPDENNANENTIYNYLSAGVDTYSAGSIDNADINASKVIKWRAIELIKNSGTELSKRGVLSLKDMGRGANVRREEVIKSTHAVA